MKWNMEIDKIKGFVATKEAKDESELRGILNSNSLIFTIQEDVKSIEFIEGIPKIEVLKGKGRSFSEKIEIQWQKLDGKFQIVAFSENESYLSKFDVKNSFDVECVTYMLWGRYEKSENGKNKFIEVSIPKYLEYPIPAKEDKRLYIKAYHYIKDGVVQFTRYLNVTDNQKGV
mgnify:CR=1 FL=1